MMSDEPLMSPIDYPARVDRRSHIEQICPLPHGESIAWLPRAARWHAPGTQMELEPMVEDHKGERKRYMLLTDAYYGDQHMRAGTAIWLFDDEVGPHHVLAPEFDPMHEGMDQVIVDIEIREEPGGVEALSPEAQAAIKEALDTLPPSQVKDIPAEDLSTLASKLAVSSDDKSGADLEGPSKKKSAAKASAEKDTDDTSS